MELQTNTEAIIRLAWCHRLGLAEDALESAADRIEVVRDGPGAGTELVRLWGTTVLLGPAALLQAAEAHSEEELLDPALLGTLADRVGPSSGLRRAVPETLSYTDGYRDLSGGVSPLISSEPAAASGLENRCPPDDRIGLGFAELPSRFVLLDEADEQRPVAGAGYAEAGPLLGRLAVLVARSHRRLGLGRIVATIAANDALDAGLVVESVVSDDSPGGGLLSESLGFTRVGCRIRSSP